MEDLFHIYIIFHKKIYEECYKDVSAEDLQKYFTFVAVNPKIEKEYPTDEKFKVIKEWELDDYDARMQQDGFHENSVIYHVWKNKLYTNYKFVGFAQYDMIFESTFIDTILKHAKHINNNSACFSALSMDFLTVRNNIWNEPECTDHIVKEYENYFNKQYSQSGICPIINTYIIPLSVYEKLMPWVSQLYYKMYPWCNQAPYCTNFGHVAGVFEMVMAFGIGEEHMKHITMPIIHDHKYKEGCY